MFPTTTVEQALVQCEKVKPSALVYEYFSPFLNMRIKQSTPCIIHQWQTDTINVLTPINFDGGRNDN